MKTYFAHSMLIYNKPEEQELLDLIKQDETLDFGNVICPNNDMGELGSMEPYLKMVRSCNKVVVHEFTGFVGRGVYSEVKLALALEKPVFAIRNNKFLPVEDIIIYDPNDWKVRYGQLVVKLK